MGTVALITLGLPASEIGVLTIEAEQFGGVLAACSVRPEFSSQSQVSHARVAGLLAAGIRSRDSIQSCGHRGAAPEQQQPCAAPHGRAVAGAGGMKRQRSSGAPGALWFFLLPGRQARSVGTVGAESRTGAAPGGGVTVAHRPGGARAVQQRREPRDHSRPGGCRLSGPEGGCAARPGLGARSRR